MELFSYIVEIIREFWESVWPFYVIDEYQRGLILRWGKTHRFIEPGFHVKRPISDNLLSVNIATETISTKPQALTTKDGKYITISLVIKYNVGEDEESVKNYLIKVRDVTDAIDDIAMVKAKETIMSMTWDEIRSASVDSEIARKTRVEAKKWGIRIDYISVVQLAEFRNIRLVT